MNESAVVVQDGLTVTKSFSENEFPVPAVTFDVESAREEEVELRIVDAIPDEFGVEQIGFHPDYGSEHWTATGDGEVRFERTVEPGESFTTVYGVRLDPDDEPTPFLEKPTIDVDAAESASAEAVPEESSSVVRELARGDRESVPGLEPDAEPGGSESIDPDVGGEPEPDVGEEVEPDVGDEGTHSVDPDGVGESEPVSVESDDQPVDAATAASEAASGPEPSEIAEEPNRIGEDDPVPDSPASEPPSDATDGDEPAQMTAEDVAETGADLGATPVEEQSADPESGAVATKTMSEGDTTSLIAALAEELRNDAVPDEDLETLRAALAEEPESREVRIEHLQSRVSDLEAYTDALKAFIDEKGRGRELLEAVESSVDALEGDVQGLEERLEAAAEDRSRTAEHLESLEDTVEAIAGVAEEIEAVREDIESQDARIETLEERTDDLAALEGDVDELATDLEELQAWRAQLSDLF